MKKITTIILSILTMFNINAAQYYIEASNFSYTPSTLTINQGDTVTWINTGGTHDVNGDVNSQTGSSFNNPESFYLSPVNSPDTIGSYIFTVSGSYDYDCSIGSHAANGMIGSINVISPPNTVYDIISNSIDHTTLEVAIDACGLDGTLSGSGPFTVFAPTDNAFNNLPAGTVTALLNDIPALTDILLHHVVGDSVMSGMLSNSQIVTTLLGTDVTVTIDSNGNVFIDNAMVTVVDLVGDNGVVHVIDAVLLPPTPPNTVYDIISNSVDHTTLETAIDACGLDGILSGTGPFTVFAPTDNAFNNLPAGTLTALLNDIPALTNILLHHVVGDSVMSGMLSNNQIVTTLLGTDVTVTIDSNGNVFIGNALVTVVDLVGENGVVHVIDAVMVPVTSSNSVYDIISASPSHTTLNTAVMACNLMGTLSGPGPFTVFAPTDNAFNNLPSGTVTALLNDIPALTDILLHHVVGDSVMSGMLSNNQTVTTLLGTDVTVTIDSNGNVFIDNALVTLADVVGDNGVVHIIDAVLLPNFDCNGIVDGPALVDTCGDCQLAYIYDYVTHNVTFLNDTNNVVLGATEVLVLPNNPMNPYWNSGCVPNTVYDIISNSVDHSTLKTAIDACSLDGTLSGPGPFTVFAPTDNAFGNLPAGTVTALLNDIPALTDILLHHVVGDSVMSGMLSNSQIVTTLLGTDVTVTIDSNGNVFIDNAMVTVVDLVGDNGVVHVIDAVLLPPTPPNTVYDIISNSVDHTTLETAIDACDLAGTLSGPGPFTVFAPTDNAFNNLPAGTLTALLNDIPQLKDILLHHVVGDSVMSGMLSNNQIVTTFLGTDVTVTINSNGDVYIDNAMVTVVDLVGDNGVVHVIDAVLLPNISSQVDISNNSNIKYLHTLNILGVEVDDNLKNQLLFRVYSDGSIEKIVNK